MINLKFYIKGLLKFKSYILELRKQNFDDEKNIYLVNTPEHGNVGDHAIALATISFIENNFPNHRVIEITHNQFRYNKNFLEKKIKNTSLICIHGGGYLGDLWIEEQEIFFEIIDKFSKHNIIAFPQTLFYCNYALINKDRVNYKNRNRTYIFLREKNSYNLFKKCNFIDEKNIFLSPDIVLSMKYKRSLSNIPKDVLLCFRKDIEKSTDDKIVKKIKKLLKDANITYKVTDTVLEKNISINERYSVVLKKLKEFEGARLVITDRLHGMIFSAVTGTPCIALDNISKKVSGVYEWIQEYDFIKCINLKNIKAEEINKLILDFFKLGERKYDIDIDTKFLCLKEQIEKCL